MLPAREVVSGDGDTLLRAGKVVSGDRILVSFHENH